MKYLIRRLLDDSTVSKSVTKKWIEMLRSDVCDAYMMHTLLFKEVSTARIIQKQQEVYGIITEMNQTEEQKEINYSTKDSKFFGYKTNIT